MFRSRPCRTVLRGSIPLLLIQVFLVHGPTARGESPSATASESTSSDARDEDRARETAVALNYCRASFHRIRRNPSKRVLIEERERILDNLNLNGIADEEVISLYTGVLEEIGQVEIAERERWFVRESYKRQLRGTLASTFFGMGMQIAGGEFVGAMRSGASGWWDVRAHGRRLESDNWQIEKERQTALVQKSAKFLDTFWRLAREQRIQDRWLVRDVDLERLETAMAEPDGEVRLRILGRMERFMECYPPYWYYRGRTQQELGQLFAASESYERMANVGSGFFRKDELLATGLANRAVIQAHLRQPEAPRTAKAALLQADDVWQANLACASVLEKYGENDGAEDAILRNLDVEIEESVSTAQLVGLYHRTENVVALRERLADPKGVAHVPAPLLAAACAQLAKQGPVPEVAVERLSQSLYAYADTRFGPDDLVVKGAANWWLPYAGMGIRVGNSAYSKAERHDVENSHEARFGGVGDFGSPLARVDFDGQCIVDLRYPDGRVAHITLARRPAQPANGGITATFASSSRRVTPEGSLPPRADAFVPISVEVDGTRLVLADAGRSDRPAVAVPSPE